MLPDRSLWSLYGLHLLQGRAKFVLGNLVLLSCQGLPQILTPLFPLSHSKTTRKFTATKDAPIRFWTY
jgi:hypothetical protein